jgi:hypothetical protein
MDLEALSIFFESEPVIGPGDVPWEYAGAAFRFQTADDAVWCRLAPGEGELAISWHQGGVKRVEISLEGYFDIRLERQSGLERLVAIPNDDSKRPVVVQLRPHVFFAVGAIPSSWKE